jgi:hypothetical protein
MEYPGWRFITQSFPRAETHIGVHVKCPLLFSDFTQNWANFIETPHFRYHSLNRSRVITCVQTDGQSGFNKLSAGCERA